MIVTYHGAAFCKVSQGDRTVAFAPPAKESGRAPAKSRADIALLPCQLPLWSGAETVTLGGVDPFCITGPGEYEVSGISIRGLASDGPESHPNSVYLLNWDDLRICHLGAHTGGSLPDTVVEALGDVDVLLLPITNTLTPRIAHSIAVLLEPHLTVPLWDDDEAALALFLKESGVKERAREEKLTFKKRDLEMLSGEVRVLAAL